jgi:hypothetical protein
MSRKVRTRRILLAALFILMVSPLIPFYSNAQVTSCPGNILKNGDFTSFKINGGTNFPPSTVANRDPSSNTPQIDSGMGCGDPGFISMWGTKAVGESVNQTGLWILAGHTCEIIRCYGPIKRGGPIKIPEEIKNIPEIIQGTTTP